MTTPLDEIADLPSVAEARKWRLRQPDAAMTAAVYKALLDKFLELYEREGGQ